MGTVAIVVLLLALCGFIAYIGDLIGRRLGKKRLSVFGLRPKHTAILLTVVTGVVIAAVTFCAALITLPWFRKVVTQGERLANQNFRLRGRNEELTVANSDREQQNRQLEASNQILRNQKSHLNQEIGKLQTNNGKLQADNGQLQTQSAALRAQTAQLQSANADIHRHNAELSTQNRDLLTRKSVLDTEVRGLRRQVTDARKEASRYQGIVYNISRDWQLAGLPLLDNTPVDVLRSTLRNLLFRARESATRHKAAPSRGRDVVYLVRPEGYPVGRPVTNEAILDWAVGQISRIRNQPLGARLLAAANCLPQESVPLRLDWYVNETVFRHGEVIGARIIDGGGTEGMILEDLVLLLQKDVGPAALRGKMYPQEDDDALGELRYDDLLQVVKKLRERKGPAEVDVVARQDIRRSGPLYVNFLIKPAGDGTVSR